MKTIQPQRTTRIQKMNFITAEIAENAEEEIFTTEDTENNEIFKPQRKQR